MEKLSKYNHILQVLKTANPKLRKSILQNSSNDVICILVEIIVNLLQGNININPNQKKNLIKFKNKFRIIKQQCTHKNRINKQKVRNKLVQTGGALPFLIPLIAPLIAKAALGGIVAAGAGAATNKILGQ